VGDIHQPLLCVSRVDKDHPQGDKGGNDITVNARNEDGHMRSVKLHSLWDGGLDDFPKMGANFAPPPIEEMPPAVVKVVQENPATDLSWQIGGPFNYTGWMQEGVELAKSKVYPGIQGGAEVGQDYIAYRVSVARQRVAWAGYRLAALLNAVWPQPQ